MNNNIIPKDLSENEIINGVAHITALRAVRTILQYVGEDPNRSIQEHSYEAVNR